MTKHDLYNAVKAYNFTHKSHFKNAMRLYALETIAALADDAQIYSLRDVLHYECTPKSLKTLAHNASYSGVYLVNNYDIVARVCTPSEYKRAFNKDGTLKQGPNSRESWLDVQAHCLFHSWILIDWILKINK